MAEEHVQKSLVALLAVDVFGYSCFMRKDKAGTLTKRGTVDSICVAPREGIGRTVYLKCFTNINHKSLPDGRTVYCILLRTVMVGKTSIKTLIE